MTRPQRYLLHMALFVAAVVAMCALLFSSLARFFLGNPAVNGTIVGIMLAGTVYVFRQVMLLNPEVGWIERYRRNQAQPARARAPRLIAPVVQMLAERKSGRISLSATSMRTLLDGIATRLEETRETSRYLIGLLICLGLLGTFYGLLETVGSVGDVLGALGFGGGDVTRAFNELKTGLQAPLEGMRTAFSASLFGLAGFLVLGFLDLQAGLAQNRFYNELEEWLSGITDLTPAGTVSSDHVNRQLSTAILHMQRAVEDLSNRLGEQPTGGTLSPPAHSDEQIRDLARGVNQLVTQMRAEQKVVREWVDEQAAQQSEVANALRELATNMKRRG